MCLSYVRAFTELSFCLRPFIESFPQFLSALINLISWILFISGSFLSMVSVDNGVTMKGINKRRKERERTNIVLLSEQEYLYCIIVDPLVENDKR